MGDAFRRSICRVTAVSIDFARASSPSAGSCPAQHSNVMNAERCLDGLCFCKKFSFTLLVMSSQQLIGMQGMNTITHSEHFCLKCTIAIGNVNSQADGIHSLYRVMCM